MYLGYPANNVQHTTPDLKRVFLVFGGLTTVRIQQL